MLILRFSALLLVLSLVTSGCRREGSAQQIDSLMGEKVTIGAVTYNVVETRWATQLGEGFAIRVPKQRFLLITLSATNGGGSEISLPFLTLQDANGNTYPELESGDGVDSWFGLLRTISPAQTQQGKLVFDVPLTSFRLKLPDGGDPGSEKFATVQIPLRLDNDSVQAPLPAGFK